MFGGKMATTPSWLSCLKPHVSWVFGQLRHFNFSGPGATHREALKSFASFFKSCEVWSRAPRPEPAQPVEKCSERGARAQRAIAPGAGSVAPCLPFPPACAKGRRTLSRAGQAGLQKTYAEPPALSGNPRRGFPAKSLPQEAFSTLLRLPKATKAAGASPPHPYHL